jgi:hypothetical protein
VHGTCATRDPWTFLIQAARDAHVGTLFLMGIASIIFVPKCAMHSDQLCSLCLRFENLVLLRVVLFVAIYPGHIYPVA